MQSIPKQCGKGCGQLRTRKPHHTPVIACKGDTIKVDANAAFSFVQDGFLLL